MKNNKSVTNEQGYYTNIDMVDNNTYRLNIQPQASILNVFSRLSYKPWYAIAEFVDNSTQSYISNESLLKSDPNFKNLVVNVKYDQKENTLTIEDNAFGMEIDKFKDAILLDSKNEEQQGRNEFGMGLKTAASWFGNTWTVSSTLYRSVNQYTTTVNIPRLKESGLNSIEIHKSIVDSNTHGTTIVISDVTKKIVGTKTVLKIRELLSSMYRRDINDKNIEIYFNEVPISFQEYPSLSFRDKRWRKKIDFFVDFENKRYNVTGFVAIMDPGSFLKAGFALFRQDRVVIGGTDLNYKPTQIFGQSQSPCSHKLFGELNMNDFPVNQAKDGFVWDDGLEEAFINELKNNIQEYITIANLTIKERVKEAEYSEEVSGEVQIEVNKVVEKLTEETSAEGRIFDNFPKEEETNGVSDLEQYKQSILNSTNDNKFVGTSREYNIPINQVHKKKVNVNWTIGKNNYWIDYTESKDVINAVINIIVLQDVKTVIFIF